MDSNDAGEKPRSGLSSRLSLWVGALLERRIVTGALKVAFVVGTVLNLINQGDHLLTGDGIQWGRFALNFVVPYCVSSYSAARIAVMRA